MGSMSVLIKKEILESIRSKKLLIIFVTFLFVAVASPIFAKLTPMILRSIPTQGITINMPDPTFTDSVDQFIKNISQIGILVLIFVVSGAVADEKNKKSLELILSKPVSRVKFVLSKFISTLSLVFAAYMVAALVFYFYTVSIFGSFNFGNFSIMAMLVLLFILMILSLTLLASTFSKNSLAAAALGFTGFIVFSSVINFFESLSKVSPNYIFSHYKDVLLDGPTSELIFPTIVTVAIIALCIIMAVLVFKNQEVER